MTHLSNHSPGVVKPVRVIAEATFGNCFTCPWFVSNGGFDANLKIILLIIGVSYFGYGRAGANPSSAVKKQTCNAIKHLRLLTPQSLHYNFIFSMILGLLGNGNPIW